MSNTESNTQTYTTDQEIFWSGEFGDQYIARNDGVEYFASNVAFFTKVLEKATAINSVIEFGPNVGLNLRALNFINPKTQLSAVEINANAVKTLKSIPEINPVYHGSLLNYSEDKLHDLSFTKGVLIHINPEKLPTAYSALYRSSRKYILIAEYFSPRPVEINYRGHEKRLFKRDFAGEMMDLYPDLKLIDYGFLYRRDPSYSKRVSEFFDDTNWFLLEKQNPSSADSRAL